MRVRDTSGTYYWHIPTGTTQWEPPSPLGKVGDSIMSSTMSLETTPCEEPDVSLAACFYFHFMHVRKPWLLLLNFPGILGSTFQHWWGSWGNGPVEGFAIYYFGWKHIHSAIKRMNVTLFIFLCNIFLERIYLLVINSILTNFCYIFAFSGRGRSSFWSEFKGVWRCNSALCIDKSEVCTRKNILDN